MYECKNEPQLLRGFISPPQFVPSKHKNKQRKQQKQKQKPRDTLELEQLSWTLRRKASVRRDHPDERQVSARTCAASDVCLRIGLERLESCKPQHHLPQPLRRPHSFSGFKVPTSGDTDEKHMKKNGKTGKRRTGNNKVRVQPRCAANPKSEAQSRCKAAQLLVSEPECVCVCVCV